MTPTRFKKPARSAIAATLAAALALSPITATPAQAGSKDKAGAIAAASFLALLTAGIIASSSARARDSATIHVTPPRDQRRERPPASTRVDRRKLLPQECSYSVNRGPDRGDYFISSCLRDEFRFWPYLPDRCETDLRTRGGRNVAAYDASCLARFGYTRGKTETADGRPIGGRR